MNFYIVESDPESRNSTPLAPPSGTTAGAFSGFPAEKQLPNIKI